LWDPALLFIIVGSFESYQDGDRREEKTLVIVMQIEFN
jgi:hypothetical protein